MGTIERIKESDMIIYINDIEQIIDDYVIELNIQDKYKIPQSQWRYILLQVHRQLIEPNKIQLLKIPNNINNTYDLSKLDHYLDVYIELCNKYIQVVYLTDYCYFMGINNNYFNTMTDNMLNLGGSNILQKLKSANENSLISVQQARGYNPILTMAQLNKNHGYNGAGTSKTEVKQVASVADAPQLLPDSKPIQAIESH